MAKGPLGNSPRDLRDDFIGEDVLYKGGEPPKKSRGPKRVTGNTFHSKVTGETSNKRADRAGHFRSGGFVRGRDGADEADMKAGFPKGPPAKKLLSDAKGMPTTNPVAPKRMGGGVKKKFADGGEISDPFSNANKARQRSESTEFAQASSDIDKAARKPTAIGRAIFPEEMALREAKRAPFEKKMEATGGYKKGGSTK